MNLILELGKVDSTLDSANKCLIVDRTQLLLASGKLVIQKRWRGWAPFLSQKSPHLQTALWLSSLLVFDDNVFLYKLCNPSALSSTFFLGVRLWNEVNFHLCGDDLSSNSSMKKVSKTNSAVVVTYRRGEL